MTTTSSSRGTNGIARVWAAAHHWLRGEPVNSQIAQGSERLALLWAVAVALGGAGGCGSTPLQIDGGPGAGASRAGGRGGTGGQSGASGGGGAGDAAGGEGGAGGGGGCPSPLLYCGASGSPDMCSDTATPATCQAGRWVCPPWTGNPGPCRCFGPPPPGCVCTDNGFQCATGDAGGEGGVPCADATTLETCDARSDCHSVFEDPRNCACAALGCCARFARCADGARAVCTGGAIACDALTPYCEAPYVVSYTQNCYEGCVRATACGP
jgi:hypothetical protein